MPCLIIVGHPSAGKTTLAKLIEERALLHNAIDEVVILNEESECGCVESDSSLDDTRTTVTTKQELYENSIAEKQTRGALKAAFDRAVKKSNGNNKNSRRLVILDSLNYIKGFRYELHCISKASGEKHGILWVLNQLSVVQQWNTNYSSALLQELISRFEPPDERNRWDKPLFTVDIAATANISSSISEDKHSQNNQSSIKNEVLEHSVYNMHFGSSSTIDQTDINAASTSVVEGTQRPTKSALTPTSRTSRTPKKSAFQRRKKVVPPSEKDEKRIKKDYNQEKKMVFDTSIITSTKQNTTKIPEKVNVVANPKSTLTPGKVTNTKSLEEQLDEILDTFLLQTQNLKEGMSTRQYA